MSMLSWYSTREAKQRLAFRLTSIGVLIILILVDLYVFDIGKFPSSLQLSIREPVDTFTDWLTFESPLRTLFFNPISDAIEVTLVWLEGILLQLPWVAVITAIFILALRIAGIRVALFAVAGFLFMGVVGLWDSALSTLTLIGVSVFISLVIGIPVGIGASRNDKVDAAIRSVIDTMQTMPAFVYLIPVMMLFGLGRVAGVVATIIYAIPPITRLTNLGLRQVSKETIEASRSFGAKPHQTLFKVEIPLAMPSILLGLNQTIMMALSMVVIAALVGSRGLGADVWSALRRIEVGRGLEGGLAIVFMAIILDRISYALVKKDNQLNRAKDQSLPGKRIVNVLRKYRYLITSLLVMILISIIGHWIGIFNNFPSDWYLSFSNAVDEGVQWMNINFYSITSYIHELVFIFGLKPIKDFLIWLPWVVLLLGVTLLAFTIGGWRMAVLSCVGILALGILGEWDFSIDTLSQVMAAVLVATIISVPLGILASRSDKLEAFLHPILDTMQTMPNFVYLIPVVILFGVGAVSGLIATIIYAVPPAIRLTNMGIRQVSSEAVEASQSFGATSFQTLTKVQIPLALPSIMLGINQTIMMALAMVIVTALIGATGLGLEVALAMGRMQIGRGFEASIAIVLMAIILDRITQSVANKQRKALAS